MKELPSDLKSLVLGSLVLLRDWADVGVEVKVEVEVGLAIAAMELEREPELVFGEVIGDIVMVVARRESKKARLCVLGDEG